MQLLRLAVPALGLAVLAWVAGALSGKYRVFPYPLLDDAIDSARAAFVAPVKFHKPLFDISGAEITDAASMSPGVTLITTYFPERDWQTGIRLIDKDGTVLHEWAFDLDEILPSREPDQDYVHGSVLLPNGDIVFNIEYAGLVKLDKCGQLIWRNEEIRSHHSVSPSHDGGFWVSGNITRDDSPAGREYLAPFQILGAPVHEDLFVKVSSDGEVMKSISSIDVLFRSGLQRIMARSPRAGGDSGAKKLLVGDIFHLNDVEELSPEMAPEYPLFEAGDIIVSLRQLSTVMVIDPDDLRVKWHSFWDTTFQHDPDFIGGGWIGVFDNNRDLTTRGTLAGGTRIAAVRPHTGERKILYPIGGADPFYSEFGGKWQLLANGNYLMAVAREARAFEVTPDGRTVWQWHAPRNDAGYVPEVLEATRYDISKDTIAGWTCDAQP